MLGSWQGRMSGFVERWAWPVFVGMVVGAVANVVYAVLMLRAATMPSCPSPSAATPASHATSVQDLRFETGATVKDLIDGDPTVLALHINNYQVQHMINQAQALAKGERRRLNKLLKLAQQELEAASSATDKIQVVTSASLSTLVDISKVDNVTLRLERAGAVAREDMSLSALLREHLPMGEEGWSSKAAPWKCLQMLCRVRTAHREYSLRRQEAERLRRRRVLLEEIKAKEEWHGREGHGSPMEAKGTVRSTIREAAKELQGEVKEQQLQLFVVKRLSAPFIGRERAMLELQDDINAAVTATVQAEGERDKARMHLEEEEASLNSSCGVLPLSTQWALAHNVELREYKAVADEAKDKWCIDFVTGDPTHRTRRGLALPASMWERKTRAEEGSVSLLVLAEREGGGPDKGEVERLVQWAIDCATAGEQSKVRKMEVYFMVSGGVQAASDVDMWAQELLEVAQARDKNIEKVLLPLEFTTVVRPQGISHFRAFNLLAHLARGSLLLLLHSSEKPGSGCQHVTSALASMGARPKLALLGFAAESIEKGLAFTSVEGSKVAAPELQFTFTSHVSGLPLIVQSSALHVVWGFDEVDVFGPRGVNLAVWMLAQRLWLAGFQVGLAPESASPVDVWKGADNLHPMRGVAVPETIDVPAVLPFLVKDISSSFSLVEKAVKEAT